MNSSIMRVSKAVAGGLTALVSAFGTAAADGTLSGDEWVTIVIAAVVGFAGVYLAPANRTTGQP